MATPIITLTTDFGTRDGYVGAVKAALAGLHVVDIAHDVPRGDVAHAAWIVRTALRRFPEDTVHLVVVDPGVGSARRGVIVRAEDRYYVGPDNGTFAYLKASAIIELANPQLWAPQVSATFHGRDIFAPVAAHLAHALGKPVEPADLLERFGPRHGALVRLPWDLTPTTGLGTIVHIDHYGNLITNLKFDDAPGLIVNGTFAPRLRTYADVASGELLCYVGSEQTFEIAVRDGRADQRLGARRGDPVTPGRPTDVYR